MDIILSKLDQINSIMPLVSDTDREEMEQLIDYNVAKIDKLVNQIYCKIMQAELSENAVKKANNKLEEDKKIEQVVFPYYWLASDYVKTKKKCQSFN